MLWAESSIKTIGNREEIWSQSFQTLALRFVRANLLSIQKLLDFAAQMWVLINKGDIYVTPFAILLKRYNASLKLNSKILSRGVLLYISHRGMCPPPPPPQSSRVFAPFWSDNGYTLTILVWNREWFSRELRSVWMYLSFQFQMSWERKRNWISLIVLFAL